ncbi:MAG: hypothetical protein WDM77_19555 [Steroidobacteraceae bacterium]
MPATTPLGRIDQQRVAKVLVIKHEVIEAEIRCALGQEWRVGDAELIGDARTDGETV